MSTLWWTTREAKEQGHVECSWSDFVYLLLVMSAEKLSAPSSAITLMLVCSMWGFVNLKSLLMLLEATHALCVLPSSTGTRRTFLLWPTKTGLSNQPRLCFGASTAKPSCAWRRGPHAGRTTTTRLNIGDKVVMNLFCCITLFKINILMFYAS